MTSASVQADGGCCRYRASIIGTRKGFILNKLISKKAVRLISIALMMVLPAAFFSGCAVGQVVQPFTPQKVNPEPYNPEPVWNSGTDVTLLAFQALKRKAGQGTAPGSGTKAAASVASAGTTSGTTPGGTTALQPTPAPPTPTPEAPAIWTISGYVKDRVIGNNIAGATVQLINNLGVTVDSVTTDNSGYYFFRDKPNVLPPSFGLNQVIASKSGYNQIPLSSRYFLFDGTSKTLNPPLELAMLIPTQQIEAADYSSPTGQVTNFPFYVGSPQKVYNGALFNSAGVWPYAPIPNPITTNLGTVIYEFTLFGAGEENIYSIDSLQFTCPDPWKFEPSTVLWTSGGNVTVELPGTTPEDNSNWIDKSASGIFYLDPTAYKPATRKVTVKVKNIVGQQLLLTYVKLTCDYHLK